MNTLPLPPPLKIYRYLLRGLEQQLWFWGQDARHGGNLLVRHGFERFRTAKAGSARYRLAWRDGAFIELHSFCVGLYQPDAPGFAFIRGRSDAYLYDGPEPADPECVCHAPLIVPETADQLAAFHAAAALFLAWAEEYEGWLEALVGSEYRAALHRHAPLPWLAPDAARRWFAAYQHDPLAAPVPRRRAGIVPFAPPAFFTPRALHTGAARAF